MDLGVYRKLNLRARAGETTRDEPRNFYFARKWLEEWGIYQDQQGASLKGFPRLSIK